MLNSSDIDDDFVQPRNTQGAPTLDGAADGGNSLFNSIFQTAVGIGSQQLDGYLNREKANAKEAAPPIVTQAQDGNRVLLWVAVAAAAIIALVLFRRK